MTALLRQFAKQLARLDPDFYRRNLPAFATGVGASSEELDAEVERARANGRAAEVPKANGDDSRSSDIAHRRKIEDLNRFRRRQILRLLADRRYRWPDDEQSRRYLQPLLDIGLDGPTAQRLCPWLSGDELEQMIQATTVAPVWGKRTLGDRYEVTLGEKVRLGLRNIECFDAQPWQVQEAIEARRREKDAEWRRRKRQAARTAEDRERRARQMRAIQPGSNVRPISDYSARHQQVYRWLEGKGWQTIAAAVQAMLDHFGLGKDSLRRTMLRIADDLVEGGLIESKVEPGPRGLKVRSVRQ